MDKQEESRVWLKFFKDAGIPKKTGASYAHIFVENRIHNDMLPELTVDYLRLMGITVMGDIIAILRHCKSVHQDSVRKVVILKSKHEEEPQSSSSCSSSDESSDDVEMIEVKKPSTKAIPAPLKLNSNVKKESFPNTETKQIKSQVGKIVPSKPTVGSKIVPSKPTVGNIVPSKPTVSKIVPSKPTTVSVVEKKTPAQKMKRKYEEESENLNQEEPTSKATINLNSEKNKLKSTTAAVKKIKVTAENDVMGPKLPPTKKTVFERLGAETEPPQVSSTTEVPLVETKFTRIISAAMPLKNVTTTPEEESLVHKTSSVFKRLGALNDDPQVTKKVGPSLPYAGVLKSPQILKRPIRTSNPVKIVRGTMRADEPEVPVKLRASTNLTSNKITIRVADNSSKDRLKPQITKAGLFRRKASNVGSQGIFSKHSQPTNVSVKQRLGLVSSSGEVTSTTNKRQRTSRQHSTIVKRLNSSFEDDDDDDDDDVEVLLGSHVERLATKKVSFGRVERKFITPVGSLHSSGLSRGASVHSRLGTTNRYS